MFVDAVRFSIVENQLLVLNYGSWSQIGSWHPGAESQLLVNENEVLVKLNPTFGFTKPQISIINPTLVLCTISKTVWSAISWYECAFGLHRVYTQQNRSTQSLYRAIIGLHRIYIEPY